ncbi:hypothetical protein LY76DRAFT_251239 [Colletotrichum caudatum]|nr:hypothetical protein LY76DRAFT_251239 [Colletotrichum caudatum]
MLPGLFYPANTKVFPLPKWVLSWGGKLHVDFKARRKGMADQHEASLSLLCVKRRVLRTYVFISSACRLRLEHLLIGRRASLTYHLQGHHSRVSPVRPDSDTGLRRSTKHFLSELAETSSPMPCHAMPAAPPIVPMALLRPTCIVFDPNASCEPCGCDVFFFIFFAAVKLARGTM